MIDTSPVTLEGRRIRLETMTRGHLPAILAAGSDPAIFRWYTNAMETPEQVAQWVEDGLLAHSEGRALPFVTIDRESGRLVGCSRFANIDRVNRRAEIGWTWLAKGAQRSGINREAKLLMLTLAFEVWGCIRVEFKTDSLNSQSRAALAGIGAREEGTLRNHMVCHDGRYRHSVYFSVTDAEWPEAKARLAAGLTEPA